MKKTTTTRAAAALAVAVAAALLAPGAGAQGTHQGESFTLSSALPPGQTHEYTATHHIDLLPGFLSAPTAGNSATLGINPYLNFPTLYGEELWTSPDHPNGTGGAKVGSMPMEFDVSDNGAAVISIPLEFPAGVNGMSPRLSLDYNSQGGDGIMGVGWSFGGMSRISRVPYTYMYSDSCGAVLFSNSDELSLDGVKLRKGSDGKFYPEIYDQSVVSRVSQGFDRLERDGDIVEYHATYRLRNESGELSDPVEWHISKRSDPYGNSIEYYYTNDRSEGAFRPDSIRYTCRAGGVPAYTVIFEYTGRTDTPRKYFSSKESSNGYRSGSSRVTGLLVSVTCLHGGATVVKYALDYSDLGPWGEKALVKVRKYGYQGGCAAEGLSSTVFEWGIADHFVSHEGGIPLLPLQGEAQHTWQQHRVFAANFDSRDPVTQTTRYTSDMVHLQVVGLGVIPSLRYNLNIFRNGGTRTGAAGDWHYNYNVGYNCDAFHSAFSDGREILAFMPADTDGDGLDEIACVYCYRNPNRAIQSLHLCLVRKDPGTLTFRVEPVPLTAGQPGLFGDFAVLDFDGDGRSDLFCTYDNGLMVFPSSEGQPFNENRKISSGTGAISATRNIVIGDFYGNGRDQIMVMNKINDTTTNTKIYHGCHREYQNGGGQFLPADAVNVNLGDYCHLTDTVHLSRCLHWGDFNHDGKRDAFVMQDDRWLFFLSKGNGHFTDAMEFTDNSILHDGYVDNTSPWRCPMYDVADFDGDGCDDLCVSMRDRHNIYGPNYDDWTYVGICRRDYLIRTRGDGVEVRCVARLDQAGRDMMIDSIKWNTFDALHPYKPTPSNPIYLVNAFVSCVGSHKGTSPCEVLYSRLDDMPWNRGRVGAVFHVTGFMDNTCPNVVTKVVDGLGATREIQYAPHSFQFPYSNAASDAGRETRPMPAGVALYRGRLGVVGKVLTETTDGTAPGHPKVFRETRYNFDEALFHRRGRGFLCFTRVWRRTQGETGLKDLQSVTDYSVDGTRVFPLLESVTEWRFKADGQPTAYRSSEYQHTLLGSFPLELGDIPTSGSGGVFLPYVSFVQTSRADGTPRRFEKTLTVRDGYGNVTSLERRYGESLSPMPCFEKTEATYENSVTTNRRVIGVPKTETVTLRLTGVQADQVVAHIDYVNDMTHGRHSERVTEQGSGKEMAELYVYDGFGNLVSVTRDIGDGHPREELTAWSEDGRFVTARTNAMGHTTLYGHNDTTGRLESVTDPNGLVTRYRYNALGDLVGTEYPSGVFEEQSVKWVGTDPQSPRWHPDTPDFGGPVYFVWSKRSGERETYTFYDQHRRKLREVDRTMDSLKVYVDYRYNDVTGLLSGVSAPYHPDGAETPAFTVHSYDYLGRETLVERPDGVSMSHSYGGTEETVTGFDGQETRLTRNPAGLVTKSSNYGSVHTTPVEVGFTRYGDGLVKTSVVDGDPATTVAYTYDVNRRPSSVTDPSLGVLTYDHNAFGELAVSTTPRDSVWYRYDALGRMTERHGRDGDSFWTYDTGWLGATDGTVYSPFGGDRVTESFSYDNLGRLSGQRQRVGEGEEWAFSYGYDPFGRRKLVIFPSGHAFRWRHDRRGFMDRVSDAAGATLWQATATDRWGNTSQFAGGGVASVRDFDAVTGLPVRASAETATQTVMDQGYEWSAAGNLLARTDAATDLRETFAYDRFNRLVSSTARNLQGTLTYSQAQYSFAPNGNVTTKDGVGAYSYGTGTGPYAVTEIHPETRTQQPLSSQTVSYTSFDKVASVAQDGRTLTVAYGIDRQRVAQTYYNGAATRSKRYFTPLYETVTENGVTKKLHYLSSATGLFAIFVTTSTGGHQMYHTFKDHQGSLAAVVHGNTVERLSHDPWGRRRNPAGFGYDNVSHTFDRGFTGHEHYDKFNLINMNGRLYDPVLGRMLSPDIAIQDEHNAQAYNRYSYCFNNPLRFTDPSGYFVIGSRNYYDWSSFVHYDFGNYRNNGSAFNTDLSEGKFSPVYDVNGYFLGTDDEGIQGEAIVMRKIDFSQGMKHSEALTLATDLADNNREEAEIRMNLHYASLKNRPDYDGFVTIDEGIAWAKSHMGALDNPTPNNMLYINTSLLDFGSLSATDFEYGEGKVSFVDLFTSSNFIKSGRNKTLRSTVYALGKVHILLEDAAQGTISILNDCFNNTSRVTDYDWNGGGGLKRSCAIMLEKKRANIPNGAGFRVYYYGKGHLNR